MTIHRRKILTVCSTVFLAGCSSRQENNQGTEQSTLEEPSTEREIPNYETNKESWDISYNSQFIDHPKGDYPLILDIRTTGDLMDISKVHIQSVAPQTNYKIEISNIELNGNNLIVSVNTVEVDDVGGGKISPVYKNIVFEEPISDVSLIQANITDGWGEEHTLSIELTKV